MAFGDATTIDRLQYEIGFDLGGAQAAMPKLTSLLGGLNAGALGAAAGIASIGLASAVAFSKATDAAAEFQSAWAEVRTILDATDQQQARLAKGILDLSEKLPESATSLAKGYYQVISAGITNAADAQQVLVAASSAATAGMTNTFTAVDAITTVLNAYGMGADQATRVSDILFQTVIDGKVTFEQLAGAIGDAVPYYAALNVPVEQLAAGIATLTKNGLSHDAAVTALKNVVVNVTKAMENEQKVARALGVELNAQALSTGGLVGMMNEVERATRGNRAAQIGLFGDIRSLNAVMTLAGKGNADFNNELKRMNESAGVTAVALEKVTATIRTQEEILKNRLQRRWIEIGNALLPVRQAFLDVAKAMLPDTMAEATDRATKHSIAIEATRVKAEALVAEYRQLISAGALTAEGQARLSTVMASLGDLLPGIVTGYDKYNKALGINLDLVKKILDRNEESSRDATATNLQKVIRGYASLSSQVKFATEDLKNLQEARKGTTLPGGGDPMFFVKRSDSDSPDVLGVKEYYAALAKAQVKLSDLRLDQAAQSAMITDALKSDQSEVGKLTAEWLRMSQAVEAGSGDITAFDSVTKRLGEIAPDLMLLLRSMPKTVKALAGDLQVVLPPPKLADPTPATVSSDMQRVQAIYAADIEKHKKEMERVLQLQFGVKIDLDALRANDPAMATYFESLAEKRLTAEAHAAEESKKLWEKAYKDAAEHGIRGMSEEVRKAFEAKFGLPGMVALTSAGGGVDAASAFEATRKTQIQPWTEAIDKFNNMVEETGPIADKASRDIENVNQVLFNFAGAFGDRISPQIQEGLNVLQAGGNLMASIASGNTLSIINSAIGVFGSFLASLHSVDREAQSAAEKTRIFDQAVMKAGHTMSELSGLLAEDPGNALKARQLAAQRAADLLANLPSALGPRGGSNPAYVAALKAIQKALHDAGIDVDVFKLTIGDLGDVIDATQQQIQDSLTNLGLFTATTFAKMMDKINFIFETQDIDNASQKLKIFIDEFKHLTGIDLSGLEGLNPDNFNAVAQALAELLTSAPEDIKALFDAMKDGQLDATEKVAIANNPTYKMLKTIAEALHMGIGDVITLFKSLLLNSGLTGDQIQEMIGWLEKIGDDMSGGTGAGGTTTPLPTDTSVGISRNVSITAQQGDSLIGAVNTVSMLMRSILDALGSAVTYLESISRGGQMAAAGDSYTFNFAAITINAPSGSGTALAQSFVVGVEERVRSMGKKIVGQRRV